MPHAILRSNRDGGALRLAARPPTTAVASSAVGPIAYCGDEELTETVQARLRAHGAGPLVRWTVASVAASDGVRGCRAVLYDAGGGLVPGVRTRDRGAGAVPLVVRVSARAPDRAMQEVMALAAEWGALRIVLRAPLDTDLGSAGVLSALREPDGGPVPLACRHLLPHVAAEVRPFLLLAVVLGRERASAIDYACCLGRSPRAVQGAHHRIGLPAPLRLLLWGQALWALWRLQMRGESAKHAARHGGFPDSSAMSATLRPVLLTTPTVAAEREGVEGLVSRWAWSLTTRDRVEEPSSP